MRASHAAIALALLGCGAQPAPAPTAAPDPAPAHARRVEASPDYGVDALERDRARPDPPPPMPEREPETGLHAGLRAMGAAARRCGERAQATDARFATCLCEAACRHRFEGLDPRLASIRFPFYDVDGLELAFRPDATVATCRYVLRADVLAEIACDDQR